MYGCISLLRECMYIKSEICLFNFKSKRRKELHVNKWKNMTNDRFLVIIHHFIYQFIFYVKRDALLNPWLIKDGLLLKGIKLYL